MHYRHPLLVAICSLVATTSSYADDQPSPFSYTLSERARYEYVGWNAPTGNAKERDYSYGHSKLQVGVKWKSDPLQAYVQGQYFQLLGLPENAVGPGANYRALNGDRDNPGDLILRQAYLEYTGALSETPLSAKLGRFLYASGAEFVNGEKSIEALKQSRIANRVIGSFDFTAGRSFDGAVLRSAELSGAGVAASVFRPTQGGFSAEGSVPIEDINIFTLVGSVTTPFIGTASDLQAFYYLYTDDRSTTVETDNTPIASRETSPLDLTIHNFGVHWLNTYAAEDIEYQTLVWGLVQTGDWDAEDHLAGAGALEVGAKFTACPLTPTVRLGYNIGTGDSNPADGDHNTFFQMLPTARQYAYVPFYNLMNNEDAFVSLSAKLPGAVTVAFDTHVLRLNSGSDLLYAGGGAPVEERNFGFAGTPLTTGNNVGILPQLTLSYEFSPQVTGSVFYGHLFPGDAFKSFSGDASIDYAFLELNFKL